MKIAIISIKPATLSSGAEVRDYFLLKGLRKSFDVSFYTPKVPAELPTDNWLKRAGHIVIGKVPYIEYLRQGTFDNSSLAEISKADIIHLEELESFFAFEKYLSDFRGKVVLDAHNIEYLKFLSDLESSSFLMKSVGKYVSQKIKQLEIQSLRHIDLVLTCSQTDKEYFSRYMPNEKVLLIPNGVDTKRIENTALPSIKNILFMGLLSYGPNEDGIQYYLRDIHPLVKEQVPNATVTIIGKNPSKWLMEQSQRDASITVVGFVEDMREYLTSSHVCICPIRSGSGTRLKVLEYMAAGRPVVSTAKGAEGINAIDGQHILIADIPNIFAEKVVDMLSDTGRAQEIGNNARKCVVENYNWSTITDDLTAQYNKLLNK